MTTLPTLKKRAFLFLPTTWSKIVISLTVMAALFVVYTVGKKIVSLALPAAPQTEVVQSRSIDAPLAHPATVHPVAESHHTHAPVISLRHPSTSQDEDAPSTTELPTQLADKPVDLNAMHLHALDSKRIYVYTFEGTATYRRKPCPNAIVVARVTAGDKTVSAAGITSADGSYAVSVPILTSPTETVDWAVEARTPESKKAEQVGRRIATEDTTDEVTLQSSLALLPQ